MVDDRCRYVITSVVVVYHISGTVRVDVTSRNEIVESSSGLTNVATTNDQGMHTGAHVYTYMHTYVHTCAYIHTCVDMCMLMYVFFPFPIVCPTLTSVGLSKRADFFWPFFDLPLPSPPQRCVSATMPQQDLTCCGDVEKNPGPVVMSAERRGGILSSLVRTLSGWSAPKVSFFIGRG